MKNLAFLKNAPNFAVFLSLLLVAFELNQNFYSANQEKMQVRLDIAKSQGDSTCYDRPLFKQRLQGRGEIFAPLVEAINLGSYRGVQN